MVAPAAAAAVTLAEVVTTTAMAAAVAVVVDMAVLLMASMGTLISPCFLSHDRQPCLWICLEGLFHHH